MKKFILAMIIAFSSVAYAKDKAVIDAQVDTTLQLLEKQVPGSKKYIEEKAKGILVLPSVVKAGFGVGGEYGEGSLIEQNVVTNYYSIASASIGFQLGVQKKDLVFIFLTDKALNDFKNSDGWTVGGDASVALVNIGASGSIDTFSTNKPVMVFALGAKGLMYNLTVEGSKISKIVR